MIKGKRGFSIIEKSLGMILLLAFLLVVVYFILKAAGVIGTVKENLPEADVNAAAASCDFICRALEKKDFCCSKKVIGGKDYYCWKDEIYKELSDCPYSQSECLTYNCGDYKIQSVFLGAEQMCKEELKGKWVERECAEILETEINVKAENEFESIKIEQGGEKFHCCAKSLAAKIVEYFEPYCHSERDFCCNQFEIVSGQKLYIDEMIDYYLNQFNDDCSMANSVKKDRKFCSSFREGGRCSLLFEEFQEMCAGEGGFLRVNSCESYEWDISKYITDYFYEHLNEGETKNFLDEQLGIIDSKCCTDLPPI